MKDKTLLKGFLIVTVLISFSGLVIHGFADTVQIDYKYPGTNSYFDITITVPGEEPKTYPGWCADSRVYVANDPYAAVLVSSCGLVPDMDKVYADDENWTAINYLLNTWNSGGYSGATWPDIQQVIWYYADYGYEINDQKPIVYDTSYITGVIIPDVEANWETYEGPPCSIIIVPCTNPSEHQLLFFMIPEIPLGTIGACITMVSAFLVKRKRTQNI